LSAKCASSGHGAGGREVAPSSSSGSRPRRAPAKLASRRPSDSASSGLPVMSPRTSRRPSGLTTSPRGEARLHRTRQAHPPGLAATLESSQQRPLRPHRAGRGLVVAGASIFIRSASPERVTMASAPLARRRKPGGALSPSPTRGRTQSLPAGCGQDQRLMAPFVQLAQPCVEIAAHVVGEQVGRKAAVAPAAGASWCPPPTPSAALSDSSRVLPDPQNVARVFAFRDAGERQAVGLIRGEGP
jgi:hypothetical protein